LNILRSAAAVITGYLIFGLSAAVLFGVVDQDPHSATTRGYMIGTILYGAFFGGVGGFVTAWIAQQRRVVHAAVVAGIIAGGAVVSILTRSADDPLWSQIAAILIIAPVVILGGWLRLRTLPQTQQR
jgi:peptidoglycan/LPS O-acetylase OafA/YrhL